MPISPVPPNGRNQKSCCSGVIINLVARNGLLCSKKRMLVDKITKQEKQSNNTRLSNNAIIVDC